MQLKHKGKQVQVTLNVPERRALDKAKDLLETIALLPCDLQELAKTTAGSIDTIAVALLKPETPRGPGGV